VEEFIKEKREERHIGTIWVQGVARKKKYIQVKEKQQYPKGIGKGGLRHRTKRKQSIGGVEQKPRPFEFVEVICSLYFLKLVGRHMVSTRLAT